MKIAMVVGTRPQFVKAAIVSKALRERHREILIHTGQHFNWSMSGVFFSGMDIPAPDYHLNTGPGSPGHQLGKMLDGLDAVLAREKPDIVLVYGDSRSTIAGALAACRVGIPLAHVEAGLRSHNHMQEEFNRVVADHLSSILFCPSVAAVRNLEAEGFCGVAKGGGLLVAQDAANIPAGTRIFNVGDVMFDALLDYLKNRNCSLPPVGNMKPGEYFLATVHRAENTDNKDRLAGILEGLASSGEKVVFPIHPRTAGKIREFDLNNYLSSPNIIMMEPVGYGDMVGLIKNARKVLTDSGGVQKEAFFLGVPCITLREDTEWAETVGRGCNVLVGCDRQLIKEALGANFSGDWAGFPYGTGNASRLIALLLEEFHWRG